MRGFRLGKGIEGFSIRIQKAQNDAVLGEKKKKGRNGAVLRQNKAARLNRPNRSRFTEPDGQTAVRTVPCFFRMERFFTLNGP